jgi:hypothetical protein
MIKLSILLTCFTFIAWVPQAWPVVFYDMDTTLPAKCSFSNTSQNRVLVENGRIEKVIFTDDSITVRMEEESGQAFVCAFKPIKINTVISVVTDKGEVQDIEIDFSNKPSEIVVLRDNTDTKKSLDDRNIVRIIDTLLAGQTPEGYCCNELNGVWRCVGNGFKASTIAQFESSLDSILMVRIINSAKCEKALTESQLCSEETQWVYLIKKILDSRETTLALVSERKKSL